MKPRPISIKQNIDALLPPQIALKAEAVGVEKVQQDFWTLLVLGVLAGAFIAFGAMFATTVLAGGDGVIPFGLSRAIAGVAFTLGLILVIVGGAELFTGNMLMVMALAAGKIRMMAMMRAWAIVYIGNLVGAVGTAVLVFLAGHHLTGQGSVAHVAVEIAVYKAGLPIQHAFFLSVLCNVLVCLAVWLTLGARTTADKILAMIFPVSAFVAAGFEHSVANMYFFSHALLIKTFASLTLPQAGGAVSVDSLTIIASLQNLFVVTIGNMVGGGLLVGCTYWFVYLRPRALP